MNVNVNVNKQDMNMDSVGTITLEGTIYFDPEDKTNKHKSQTSWKKMAMVIFKGDICQYYAWFIKKRFGIDLSRPLRGAHISFINDSIDEMTTHCNTTSERRALWEKVKKKYHRKKISCIITTSIPFFAW